jgi:hypothetical protein
MTTIVAHDLKRHVAPADDPYWQESFFLCWTDVRTRCAFHCHVSLSPFHNKAHVWAWLLVDGQEVGRYQEHALPLPVDDLDDMSIGIAHFVAGETLRQLKYRADFGNARMEVDYISFTDPIELHYNTGNLKLGSRHYESMGSVRGCVIIGEREIPINGFAWHDHSWGARHLASNPAGRWVFAIFGDDLAFSVFSLGTDGGHINLGYVLDRGEIHPIEQASCGVVVADDGFSPQSCDAMIWTTSGRAYRVRGSVLGTALVGGPGWSGDGSFVWMDGLAQFECGGRIGSGIIEVSNLKTPTNVHKAVLNIA